MSDNSHKEKWADFVRTHHISEWKPQVSALVDSQLEIASAFYERLAKTKNEKKVEEIKRSMAFKP